MANPTILYDATIGSDSAQVATDFLGASQTVPFNFGAYQQAALAPQSEVLYVATDGSDSNSGTIDSPFKSISAAASAATPGTQILVMGGTYTNPVTISSSGTASANITISPYSGETVVLDGSNLPAKTDMVSIYGNYVTFQGFDVANAPGHGIIAWATHGVTIENNSVHGSRSGGIWVGGDVAGQSYNNAILNNTVFDNVLENQSRSSSSWPSALQVDISDNAQISGNTVYDNYGEGIDSLLSSGTQISQNIVHDNYSMNIYLDNSPHAVVNRNFIYSTENRMFFIHGHAAEGIGAAIESYSTQRPLTDITVTNNIDVGDDYGFYYGAYGHGGGMQGALIANNTFVDDGRSAIHTDPDAGNSGNQVVNNIFYSSTGNTLANGTATGSLFDHNLWFGGSHTGFAGSGDVSADPKLASPGSLSPASYELLSGSPAAGAGIALAQVVTDFSGASRTVPFSIGAYQA